MTELCYLLYIIIMNKTERPKSVSAKCDFGQFLSLEQHSKNAVQSQPSFAKITSPPTGNGCSPRAFSWIYRGEAKRHTHTHLTALCPGLPGWAGTRKVKPIWILLEQETVSGSGISWTICKSAPCSRQITTPAPTTQFFTGRMPFLPPNQQCQSTEGEAKGLKADMGKSKRMGRRVKKRGCGPPLLISWSGAQVGRSEVTTCMHSVTGRHSVEIESRSRPRIEISWELTADFYA